MSYPQVTPEEISEMLEQAADLLEKGWTQGDLRRHDPVTGGYRYCALGAVRKVSNDMHNGNLQYEGLVYVIKAVGWGVVPEHWDRTARNQEIERLIFEWNDHDDRIQSDVLDAFRKAAKSALGVDDDDGR